MSSDSFFSIAETSSDILSETIITLGSEHNLSILPLSAYHASLLYSVYYKSVQHPTVFSISGAYSPIGGIKKHAKMSLDRKAFSKGRANARP